MNYLPILMRMELGTRDFVQSKHSTIGIVAHRTACHAMDDNAEFLAPKPS